MTDFTYSDWRKLAQMRQFIIDKLDRKNADLEARLRAANARVTMYEARERRG